ncbi:MAG: hypothetical protein LBB72_01410 [Spirochaetaceae bacterium]|jgi:hypothetical protein|nr:hypothetical protein [Spirochaetaceae bacterium]
MKKQRMVQACIAVLAAVFVLGFVGCGGGGGGGGPDGPVGPTSDATLTSVKFNSETAVLGTPAAALTGVTAGSVTLLQSNVTVTATATDSAAVIEFVTDTGSGIDEEDFFATADTSFENGDVLVIKVTNGTAKLYYKIAITVIDVSLDSLTVDGVEVTPLPSPGTTWQSARAGSVLLSKLLKDQLTDGIVVLATAEGATIEYGQAVGNAEPTFSSDSTIIFTRDGEFLYIKVTKGSNTAYYKVGVYFQQSGTILYGSPEIEDGVIDPLWENEELDTYHIIKLYQGDCSDTFIADPHTYAEAKAMWDEEGLYLFVEVTDPEVSDEAATSNHHEKDSFELFVNEGLPSKVYGEGGSQYRVGANGERSGEGDSPAALNALNKTSAWKTDTGYIVIMQAPWRLRNKFWGTTDGQGSYKDGWKLGFELQINAAPETGSRYGVVVWNNIAHTNYMNANDYGEATLAGHGDGAYNFAPLPPLISAQPEGGVYAPAASVSLSVTASTKDDGTLSYKWYKADSMTAAGTVISGATSATYAFTAGAEGSKEYYYAEVINTIGTETSSVFTGRAQILATAFAVVDKLSLAENYAVYKFELPDGAVFDDYKSVTVDYFMDKAEFDKGIRSFRLHGNYNPSSFASRDGFNHFAFDSANAAYIYDDRGGSYVTSTGGANKWFTLTLRLNGTGSDAPVPNGGFNTANKPAANAAGPFYFGIGIPGNADGAKTQYVKNITMVHNSDPAKNVVTTSFFGFVGYTAANNWGLTSRELALESEVPYQGISITIDKDYTDPLAGVTNQTFNLSKGNLEITAPAGYDTYEWKLNNVVQSATTNTFTVLAANYVDKINQSFTVTVKVTDSAGKNYSQSVIFTVKK